MWRWHASHPMYAAARTSILLTGAWCRVHTQTADNVTPILLSALGCRLPDDEGTVSAAHSAQCADCSLLDSVKQLFDQM